ncbi:MAG: M14 family zinc carboxypeptidase, partial [Candidatus Krumholzibacteriia bacterium]
MTHRLATTHLVAMLLLSLATRTQAQYPDPAYWRLDAVNQQLAAWAAAYPDLIQVTVLGQSGLGEDIPLVCISDHAAVREPEPGVLLHGAQHANECNGTTAIMQVMRRLLERYGSDPAITARVDGLELWFVPIVNVDGHRFVFSGAPHWQDWRKTLRDNNGNGEVDFPHDGVDLNRNWDWRWQQCPEWDPSSQQYRGPHPFSEPEARALRDLVLRERPALVCDLHSPVTIGYHSEVFYPWLSSEGAPDVGVASDLAGAWSAATRNLQNVAYHDIVCYDTLPKEQCWVYGEAGVITLLMEIEDGCWFTGADVDTIGHRVARGAMALLDRALVGPGITGTVTSALTGEPLAAEVIITEMNASNVGPR